MRHDMKQNLKICLCFCCVPLLSDLKGRRAEGGGSKQARDRSAISGRTKEGAAISSPGLEVISRWMVINRGAGE